MERSDDGDGWCLMAVVECGEFSGWGVEGAQASTGRQCRAAGVGRRGLTTAVYLQHVKTPKRLVVFLY